VDEVRYDYGYGEYIGNMSSGSCQNNTTVVGIPAQESSSKVSFMLNDDPAIMNSEANNLAANWSFSTSVYDEAGNQVGTPGEVNDEVSSINDPLFAEGIKVFPNPASTLLNIATELEGDFKVVFYNVMGQQIGGIQVNERTIYISKLAVGLYSMKISLGEKSTVKKVVVQR